MSSRPRRRRSVTAAAVLVITMLAAGCATTTAEPADPPRPSTSATPAAAAEQTPDDLALAARIDDFTDALVGGREDVEVPGLAGITVDQSSGLVDVYWVGDPPAEVRRLLDRPPSGVSVALHPARHDVAAMVQAVEDVSEKYGAYMHGGSPTDDGSGIEIEQTAAAARRGPSLQEWARAAGMPVTTSVTEPAEPAGS